MDVLRFYAPSGAISRLVCGIHTQRLGPIEESVERKITETLEPLGLEIVNESHLHAHHAAMRGNTNPETHFRITIVSDQFAGKSMMQRHRLVYSLLNEELQNGIHALSLKTKTKEEMEKAQA